MRIHVETLQFNPNRALRRGSVWVDLETLIAMRGKKTIQLTPREVDILGFAKGVFTHDDIIKGIKRVWGEHVSKEDVGTYKHELRTKLGKDLFKVVRRGEYTVNESLPPHR